MKKLLLLLWAVFPGGLLAVTPLQEATFTEIINDVKVLLSSTKSPVPAKRSDQFKTPDVLRTAANSLAELTAIDNTITRIGANTSFSFDPQGRTLKLEQGSVLFHSPKGKGGGTIKTGGASASVLGTTLIVVTTADGGFKAIVLEGKGEVRLPNGAFRVLRAGQLVFVLPGSQTFGPVLMVSLDKLVRTSRLVNGFNAKLPSLKRIEVEAERQNLLISSGRAEDTGLLVGNEATKDGVRVVSSDTVERAVAVPVQLALRTDATISTSLLDPAHLFLEPFQLRIPGGGNTTFRGFVGKEITLTTPFLLLDAYTSGGFPEFDIRSAGKLKIMNSLSFSGLAAYPYDFKLAAIGGIEIAPGSTLTTKSLGNFHLESLPSMSFVKVNFQNPDGGVLFDSNGDIALSSGSVLGNFIKFTSEQSNVDINGGSFLRLAQGPGNLVGAVGGAPGPRLDSIDILSGNNLTINSASLSGLGASELNMFAESMLEVKNTTIGGFGSINLEARTVILQNIDFPAGSTVLLKSQNGLLAPKPNTSQPIQNGFVNYLNNVSYNKVNLTSAPHPNITISALP